MRKVQPIQLIAGEGFTFFWTLGDNDYLKDLMTMLSFIISSGERPTRKVHLQKTTCKFCRSDIMDSSAALSNK